MWGRGGRRVPRVGGRPPDAGAPGPAWSKQDDRFRERGGGRRDGGGQTRSFRRRPRRGSSVREICMAKQTCRMSKAL
ncbi:hypothetical protein Nmel_011446 [Mimus melanotis]